MAAPAPLPAPAASVQTASASVHRDAVPEEQAEEPAVQAAFVQRQEEEAPEEEA